MDLIATLTHIGLTEYEARVYLALLEESPANGYQVSKRAGIPRSMVYEALGRLDSRGAVLKNRGPRATTYRPTPPDVLLDHYQQEQLSVVQSLRNELGARFEQKTTDDLWTVKGRQNALSFAAQMVANASRELLLVLCDADLAQLRERVAAAHRRGVAVKALLTGEGHLAFGEVAHHPPLESQLHGLEDMLIVVADQAQVLIASVESDTTATITNNPNMLLITRQFIWMELFTQRINAHIGPDLLELLAPEDRRIFESLAHHAGEPAHRKQLP